MPSQFFGLNIAASGLRAANASLLATGNNIANTTTDGYSRQKVTQEAADALRVFTKYGCAGAGVGTLAIERVRDAFYDTKYRENATYLGKYEQRDYFNDLIERYFEDDGRTGFSSLFTRMQADLQTVLTMKTDDAKTNYIGSVKSMTEYFNNLSGNMKQLQQNVNDEIKLLCDNVNACAQKITVLNKQINTIELTGAKANDLRDKRDLIIDELSKYMSIEVKETRVIDESDPLRVTGGTRLTIHVAGGDLLLDDTTYRQMICVAREGDERVNQEDIDGLYDIKWASSNYKDGSNNFLGTFDLGNQLMGGKLQGLIDIRDGNNGQYFHGAASKIDDLGDQFAITIAGVPDYCKDMNKSALYEDSVITIGSRSYHYKGWEFNDDDTYTFYVDKPARTVDQDILRSEVSMAATTRIGRYVSYQGIPYYMTQMNEWIRNFSAEVNDVLVGGFTADSEDGVYMLTGKKAMDSASLYAYDELNNDNKKYSLLTASNFAVNDVLLNTPSRLATKSDKTEGNEQMAIAQSLYDMAARTSIFRNATAGEFLAKVQADISLNRNNSKTMLSTYTSLENTIGNQRLSVSGVDKDEEALSLVEYQNAYTLSSKMIQTLTEIYDRLILQTGV